MRSGWAWTIGLIALGGTAPDLRADGRFPATWQDETVCDSGGTIFPRIALGDLDRDGRVDLVRTEGPAIVWCRGLGDADFAPPLEIARQPGGAPRELLLGDIDRDGDLDVLVTATVTPLTSVAFWFPNDGQGTLGTARPTFTIPLSDPTVWQARLADLDGDADLDLVVRAENAVWIGRNDGSGVFAAGAGVVSAFDIRHVEVGDLDDDGRVDLVFSLDALAGWARNEGDGFAPVQTIGFSGTAIRQVALADIDRNGHQDVLLARAASIDRSPFQVHRNAGGGGFGAAEDLLSPLVAGVATALAVGDVDLDARPDLACQRQSGASHLRCWLQNFAAPGAETAFVGPWDVSAAGIAQPPWGEALTQQFADLDRDGDPDLVMSAAQQLPRRSRNDAFFGASRIAPRRGAVMAAPRDAPILDLATSDYLALGRDQIAYALADATATQVMLVQDDAPAQVLHADPAPQQVEGGTLRLHAARIDRDARPDLLLADGARARLLWLRNSGAAPDPVAWSAHPIVEQEVRTEWIAIGDLDGDGRPDVAGGAPGRMSHWWRQPASLDDPWSAQILIGDVGLSGPMALADFNLDDKLDVISAGPDGVYWGEALTRGGSRVFNAANTTLSAIATVQVADMDQDGDPDAILAPRDPGASGGRLHLLLNPRNRSGWARVDLAVGEAAIADIDVRDVDRDGDIDLVVAFAEGSPGITWFENRGQLQFAAHAGIASAPAGAVTIADLDGDGDADVVANRGEEGGSAFWQWHELRWGQAAVEGLDVAPAQARFGEEFALIGFEVAHLGRANHDGPASLNRLHLRLTDADLRPLDTAAATELIETATLVRDDGDRVPSPGDTVLGNVGAPLLFDGGWTLSLATLDPALRQLAPATVQRYFLRVRVPDSSRGGRLRAELDTDAPGAASGLELRPAFIPFSRLAVRPADVYRSGEISITGSIVFDDGFE